MPYAVCATWVAQEGEEERVATARQLIGPSRDEPGNLIYQLHRDPGDPRRFFAYEQYADRSACDAHLSPPSAVEVRVGVKQRRAGSHARSRDQAVEHLADRHSLASGVPEPRGEREVVQTLQAQDGEGTEMTLHELGLWFRSEPLEHLRKDQVCPAAADAFAPVPAASPATA